MKWGSTEKPVYLSPTESSALVEPSKVLLNWQELADPFLERFIDTYSRRGTITEKQASYFDRLLRSYKAPYHFDLNHGFQVPDLRLVAMDIGAQLFRLPLKETTDGADSRRREVLTGLIKLESGIPLVSTESISQLALMFDITKLDKDQTDLLNSGIMAARSLVFRAPKELSDQNDLDTFYDQKMNRLKSEKSLVDNWLEDDGTMLVSTPFREKLLDYRKLVEDGAKHKILFSPYGIFNYMNDYQGPTQRPHYFLGGQSVFYPMYKQINLLLMEYDAKFRRKVMGHSTRRGADPN